MTTTAPAAPSGAPAARKTWYRRPWVVPLGALVLFFLAMSLPRYLTLDPARSQVPAPPGFPWHYPVLVAHILFGTVAMVTAFLQVWPWFRQRFPVAHRRVGRVYVLGGVLPAGLAGLAVGAVSPFGPMTRVGDVLLAALWLGSTAAGFRHGRARRFAEHRVWMVRSATLTFSIILNRLIAPVAALLLAPRVDSAFGGSELAMVQTVGALSAWLGWVLPLLVVEWWLTSGPRARRAGVRQPDRAPVVSTP
ncbi:DUF2306 domain-containing protein [Actinokineospora bangkokensis]|uniref:DUF2306 domain-containing protein n=1 Tax=Actinokineospora bangkokensis TaxID=1193682 RepID=A0A1Q9LSM2_9PSEU|nr:DUF2306 domain-containing protein [Actinokineospora bangkokensis]OLR95035.1 hypothetical protein BJP25_08740 [Actinokineospora bangkokensis]